MVHKHLEYFKWITQKHAAALAIVVAGVEAMDGF